MLFTSSNSVIDLVQENNGVVMKHSSDWIGMNPGSITGCVAYYDLNGNSNDRVGANNGTDTSISYVSGRLNEDAQFNGNNSKITLPNVNSGDFSTGMSISMWLKSSKNNFGSTNYQCKSYGADVGIISGNYWKGRKGIDAAGGKLVSVIIPNTEYGSKVVAIYGYQTDTSVFAGTFIIKDNFDGTVWSSGNLSKIAIGDSDKRMSNPYILELNGHDVLIEIFFSDTSDLFLDYVNYGNGGYDGIIFKGSALSIIEFSNGAYRVHINGAQISSGGNNDVIANNVWQHVVFTYDNINFKIYRNGSLLRTIPYTTPITINSNSITVGESGLFSSATWWGEFDELAIWNRALNPLEIQRVYNNGYPKFKDIKQTNNQIEIKSENNQITLKEVK